MHQLQELVRLHRLRTGAREVARLLGVSPNTEREYRIAFTKAGLLEGPVDDLPSLEVLKATLPRVVPRQQTSTVEDWTSEVKRLVTKGCEARAIHDHLYRERPDFTGSYYAVKRLVKRLRVAEGVRARDVVIPVVTDPVTWPRWTSATSATSTIPTPTCSERHGCS